MRKQKFVEGDLRLTSIGCGQGFRVCIRKDHVWRDRALWNVMDLREHCEKDRLTQIHPGCSSIYAGVYRESRENEE